MNLEPAEWDKTIRLPAVGRPPAKAADVEKAGTNKVRVRRNKVAANNCNRGKGRALAKLRAAEPALAGDAERLAINSNRLGRCLKVRDKDRPPVKVAVVVEDKAKAIVSNRRRNRPDRPRTRCVVKAAARGVASNRLFNSNNISASSKVVEAVEKAEEPGLHLRLIDRLSNRNIG